MNRARRGRKGDGGGPSRRQLDQIPASSYQNSDEALEAGVELEEKAERFSVGDKASKYYTLALEAYERALQIDGSNANAAYNAARVLYTLASVFSVPMESINILQQAVVGYRQALSLTPKTVGDGEVQLPNAFHLDIEYNLAISLLQCAEQYDRIGTSSDAEIQQILREAIGSFNNVLTGQQYVLQCQKGQELQMSQEGEKWPATAPSPEQDGVEEERSDFTASPTTPSSVLETIGSIHSAACSLLDRCENADEATDVVRMCSTVHAVAQELYRTYPDAAQRYGEIDWIEQTAGLRHAALELRISSLVLDRSQGTGEEVMREARAEAEQLLLEAQAATNDLATTSGRAMQQIQVQSLHQLGDLLLSLSRTCMGRLTGIAEEAVGFWSDDNAKQATVAIWQLLTLSSKLFLSAVKHLDASGGGGPASSAVVVGEVTISTTMRRRSALFNSLSTVSALRSTSLFTTSGYVDGADVKTRATLLDNARVYARKALAEVGLTWLFQESNQQKRYKFAHGGLESLGADVDAVLAYLNALCLRATSSDSVIAEGAQRETALLVSNIVRTILSREEEIAYAWRCCLGIGRGQSTSHGEGILEQIVGDEGTRFVSPSERMFWGQLEDALNRVD